jgi:hypothetical protein
MASNIPTELSKRGRSVAASFTTGAKAGREYQAKQNKQQTATNNNTSSSADLSWREWLPATFPNVAEHAPCEYHEAFWDWIDALRPGEYCRPFVACVFRGAGKSTTFELGAVRVGITGRRKFVLVVSETQAQADERVQHIRTLFEKLGIGAAVTKQGSSRGWRRDELRADIPGIGTFYVAGIGLEVAVRGVKFDEYRPDWIHLDDVDNREDTKRGVDKKERAITQGIFKAGARGAVVSFAQNLIWSGGIMARVLGKEKLTKFFSSAPKGLENADYLTDAVKIGPIPGFYNFKHWQEKQADGSLKWRMSGTPVWHGFSEAVAEYELGRDGLRAFRREVQHETEEGGGGLWEHTSFLYWHDHYPEITPSITKSIVSIDPSGSARGDEVGIVSVAKIRLPKIDENDKAGAVKFAYLVTEDASDYLSPKQWATAGVRVFREQDADTLAAESNFGGEMVSTVFETVPGAPKITLVRVSRGKIIRAEPVQKLYEDGLVYHARKFSDLENELKTWSPESGKDSPGRLDAVVIGISILAGIADFVHEQKSSAIPLVASTKNPVTSSERGGVDMKQTPAKKTANPYRATPANEFNRPAQGVKRNPYR